MKRFLPISLLVLMLAFTPASSEGGSSARYTISQDVLASGGQVASSASYAMASSFGLPLIGNGASASYKTESGFWTQLESAFKAFLPGVLKNH